MQKNNGFTLIELLIVIAILLILFAVGFNSCMAWHYSKSERVQSVEIITQEEEMHKEMPVEIKPLNKPEGEKNKL